MLHPCLTARLAALYLASLVLPAGSIVMTNAIAWRDDGPFCSKRFLRDTTLPSQIIKQKQILASCLFGHPRDLDVQDLGRREGSAASGGLSALQFVQRPV
jgi:hypothetical protein